MKAPARFAPAAAILGALLVLTGCTTTKTTTSTPVQPVATQATYQFAVMEKSKDLEVTPQLLAELRESVASYLKDQGLTSEGEYIVKVNLTPSQSEETGQWVVLKINSVPARTYTLLAAYPGADDYYPYDYYGFYNYGYGYPPYGYYDPFGFGYGYGYGGIYYPPVPPRHHHPGEPGNHPPATNTRWDSNSNRPAPGSGQPRPNDGQPRPSNPRGNGPGGGGGSYSPPAFSPPPARVESAPQPREDHRTPATEEK